MTHATTSARRHRARTWAALVGLGALCCVQVALVVAGLPYLRSIPAWFYGPTFRGLGAGWAMLAVCVLVPWLASVALHAARNGRRIRAYAAVFVLALSSQALFVPLDARRVESLLSRHEGGHGEFHVIAAQRREVQLDTLRRYDELAETRQLGAFPPSKPPGALAIYMGLDALGRGPLAGHFAPLRQLARHSARVSGFEDGFVAAALLFPLATALLAPLVLALGVRLHGDHGTGPSEDQSALVAASAAAILTATSPALLLITYHLDGACYPLLALLALWCLCRAMQANPTRGSVALVVQLLTFALLAGGLFGLGLYVSFSLVPALGLAVGVVLAVSLASAPETHASRRALLTLFGFALGVAAVTGALMAWLEYHPVQRFQAALAYHARWKAGVPAEPWRVGAFLEWTLYAGAPLVALLVWRAGASLAHLRDARRAASTLLPLGVFTMLLALSALTGTNEVARMWLFMVPVAALAAVSGLRDTRLAAALGAMQLLIALVMKANQPW
ncbi:MAG: hypothetical protein R3B40_18280 [Polyangiales bacterium]|nr:hypothetical protein [Sandaracinaceae bacterium]